MKQAILGMLLGILAVWGIIGATILLESLPREISGILVISGLGALVGGLWGYVK